MEQKHIVMSAVGVGIGVGVGVGLGLASGQTLSKWTGSSSSSNLITPEKMQKEMLNLIIDGKDSNITFDSFPYYISDQTRILLTNAAYVHFKKSDYSKYTRNLAPASRKILLSGPAGLFHIILFQIILLHILILPCFFRQEFYHQMLAKALSHCFEAKLLLLDVNDFILKIQSKYGAAAIYTNKSVSLYPKTDLKRSMSDLFGSLSMLSSKQEGQKGTLRRQSSSIEIGSRGTEASNLTKLRRNASISSDTNDLASNYNTTTTTTGSEKITAPLKRTNSLSFDEKLLIQTLYKILVSVSKKDPIVLYIRDVDKLLSRSDRMCNFVKKMLEKLSGPILILGSHILEDCSQREMDERVTSVFPYNIEIKAPVDETRLVSWNTQLQEDMKMIQFQDNMNHIIEVMSANDLDCDDFAKICTADTVGISNYIEEIVMSAISYHLMNNKDPQYRNGKLVISSDSLAHGLSIFQEGKSSGRDTLKMEAQNAQKDVAGAIKSEPKNTTVDKKSVTKATVSVAKDGNNSVLAAKIPEKPPQDNEFEKHIRPDVVPANEINVSFEDIGAMEEIKESLQELVMLPLRRPDLFVGGLLKPCRGILLFGPPGTGKTMLAKAIAKEAGASFINVSMSTITSKWFGEDEKNIRALFTLAAKVSPTIIFVDEVDSMLGQRTRVGEHESMRKIKNEFMTHWDGLLTKASERILVLAATNRPFDLDEAIIRRFERRIMVGLPSVENRVKILKALLSKESGVELLDFKELGTMTEGYSGSDLKNLCTTAAYRPVRELIKREQLKDMEKKQEDKEEKHVSIRPLNMADFREAKTQVGASFATEGAIMGELKQWDSLYGEGGSRKKEQLTYFM
ncbi:putative cell division cycle ATPase [Impatiens glandulifera]|uniref:putative cell division cycle ATPase n=1 Tax=Impatiens glandulifera TaxID=253017 RepID=UPI001FB19F0A|nr:putative cell division cycle ATPase [Impatiens glandulifera]